MQGSRAETGVLADGKYLKRTTRDLGKPTHSAAVSRVLRDPEQNKTQLAGARAGALGKAKNKPDRCSKVSKAKPSEPDDGGSLTNP
jgi:hypothetical protein